MSIAHGVAPEVKIFPSAAEEIAYIREHIESLIADGTPDSSICVVARTKNLLDIYTGSLESAGLHVYQVKRDSADQREHAGIRLATMHRVKGLEFEHMIVAGANQGIVPLNYALAAADDAVTQRNFETGERALLYVALTRAKRSALVTAYGEPSPYLCTQMQAGVQSLQ
jgi:superfamily I DNA/RNA helicase